MARSFALFGITFYPYSLLMAAGVGVTLALFAFLTFRRHGGCAGESIFALEALIVATAAALPAALFFDALFKWMETGVFSFDGATFYGGLLGGLALFCVVMKCKKNKTVSLSERLNDLAPAIPAGHCLGRVGCFLGGCCFGKPTCGPFGVVFPEGSLAWEYYGGKVAVHPTQLYEAAFLALLALFLLFFAKKRAFPLYCLTYGAGRFLLEFLRGDDRGALLFLPLSPAQGISLCLFALGAALLLREAVRHVRKKG